MNGGSTKTPAFREIVREYGKKAYYYAYCVDIILGDLDRETGTLQRWPFGGCSLEQPAGTREAWMIMQGVYFRKIQRDREKQMQKGKGRVR